MFKKVDRFLNLNHLSDCSTIAAPESGSKPKVVNAVSYAIPKRTKSSAWSAGDRSSKRTIKGEATTDQGREGQEGLTFGSNP